MQELKTALDLIRFVAGTTRAMENMIGTISTPVAGGTKIHLSLMEWHVLDRLARHEKRAKQNEQSIYLLQSALVSAPEAPKPSALSILLSNLEFGKKLIKRERARPARFRQATNGTEDGRNRAVSLTKIGRAVHARVSQHLETALAQSLKDFSPEEIHHLAEAAEKVRNATRPSRLQRLST